MHRAKFHQVSINIILCASRNVSSSIYEHYFVCIAQRYFKYLRTLFCVHRATFLEVSVSTNIISCASSIVSSSIYEHYFVYQNLLQCWLWWDFQIFVVCFCRRVQCSKKTLYLHLKIIKKTRSSPCYATANRTTQPLSYRSAERPTHLVSKQLAAFLHQQPEPEKVRGKGKTSTTKISLTLCCMIYFFRRFFEI